MNDENYVPIEPPDPDHQLPAPDEPAGQLEPPEGGARAYEPRQETTRGAFEEPIPTTEEPRMAQDYVVPPPLPGEPARNTSRTVWIVVIVALLLLCCCCLIAIVAASLMIFNYPAGTQFWYFVPSIPNFM